WATASHAPNGSTASCRTHEVCAPVSSSYHGAPSASAAQPSTRYGSFGRMFASAPRVSPGPTRSVTLLVVALTWHASAPGSNPIGALDASASTNACACPGADAASPSSPPSGTLTCSPALSATDRPCALTVTSPSSARTSSAAPGSAWSSTVAWVKRSVAPLTRISASLSLSNCSSSPDPAPAQTLSEPVASVTFENGAPVSSPPDTSSGASTSSVLRSPSHVTSRAKTHAGPLSVWVRIQSLAWLRPSAPALAPPASTPTTG